MVVVVCWHAVSMHTPQHEHTDTLTVAGSFVDLRVEPAAVRSPQNNMGLLDQGRGWWLQWSPDTRGQWLQRTLPPC